MSSAAPLRRDRRRAAALLLAPMLLLWLGLLVLPILQAVGYSLTNWDGFTARWIGLGNYAAILHDPAFGTVILNNAILLAAVPFAVILPFVFALLIDAHPPGWRLFRMLIFLPATLSWVVIGIVAVHVFTTGGVLSDLLGRFGLHLDLLGNIRTAILPIMFTFVWSQVGPNTLIFLIGLATLDRSLLEAARLDGAGPLRLFLHVTLPLLRRFVVFALATTLIAAFTALFSLIFVMTGGGPGFSTTTLEFFIYRQAFNQDAFGRAAALGVLLFLLVGAMVFLLMRLFRYDDA